MINIRYHIVSITAVFLALGIGVALGSTFLDRATVDVLNRNIRNAENRIAETNATNERLSEQLELSRERDGALIITGSEELVDDHLTDIPLLIVTAPGVESERVDAMRTVLERSGADLRGTLQLRGNLAFDGDTDDGLAEELGLDDPTALQERIEVMSQLRAAFVAAGTPMPEEDPLNPEPDDTDPLVPQGQPEIITTLLDRDYLRLDPGPGLTEESPILETGGYRYVMVGAPDLVAEENNVLLSLLPTGESASALPAVVTSDSMPEPEPDQVVVPNVVQRVRTDDTLDSQYNTVDNTETFAGLVATVFVLEDMEVVLPGHYGQDEGASAVLPPPR